MQVSGIIILEGIVSKLYFWWRDNSIVATGILILHVFWGGHHLLHSAYTNKNCIE